MGNTKYPLNGRYLTLGDLVSEYGFNTAGSDNASINEQKFIDISTKFPEYNGDTSKIEEIYNQFKNDIQGTLLKSTNSYELCYFPTVYSDTIRTNDNLQYAIILEGDDSEYSPDVYIKYSDVTSSYRIIKQFHYVYNNLNDKSTQDNSIYNVNNSANNNSDNKDNIDIHKYDTRFLFNYKRKDGLCTASYALLELYNLFKNNDTVTNLITTIVFADNNTVNNNGIYTIDSSTVIKDGFVKNNAYEYLANMQYVNPNVNYKLSYYKNGIPELTAGNGYNIADELYNKIVPSSSTKIYELDTTNIFYYNYNASETLSQTDTVENTSVNLFVKALYYIIMLTQCLKYKTGIIADALYSVINPYHNYTSQSPLYRCDVGANIRISSVILNPDLKIEILYGLPARSLEDTDIIHVRIPIIATNELGINIKLTLDKTWKISEIIELLKWGLQLNDDSNDEWMKLYNTLNTENYYTGDFKTICNSSLGIYLPDNNNTIKRECLNESDISIDSSLNIYNAKTNPGYDTSALITNSNTSNMFIGKLKAHILYEDCILKDCFIPIYRLANYYYITRDTAFTIKLSFIVPEDQDNVNAITYNITENTKTMYLNGVSNDIPLYLTAATGNTIENIKYITGCEDRKDNTVETAELYNNDIIKIHNHEISSTIATNAIYYLFTLTSTNTTISFPFENGSSTNVQLRTLTYINRENGGGVIIHNNTSVHVSMLLKIGNNTYIYTDFIEPGEHTTPIKVIVKNLYFSYDNQAWYLYMYNNKETKKMGYIILNEDNFEITSDEYLLVTYNNNTKYAELLNNIIIKLGFNLIDQIYIFDNLDMAQEFVDKTNLTNNKEEE